MTEKSVDQYVEIAIRFQRDQDFRLYIVHMRAKKSEIGTEKMFDLMLAALGAFEEYEQLSNVDMQLDRPVILVTGEMLRNFVFRTLHPELAGAA